MEEDGTGLTRKEAGCGSQIRSAVTDPVASHRPRWRRTVAQGGEKAEQSNDEVGCMHLEEDEIVSSPIYMD